MINLNHHQRELLEMASENLKEEEIDTYIKLRTLLPEKSMVFRNLFKNYYRLNNAFLSEAFEDRFFELLFTLNIKDSTDPYTPILKELYEIPRQKGDKSLQCSFVSKLVAIHDENYPIYDKHISAFFGISVPSYGDVEFRIAGFVNNINWLSMIYNKWSEDDNFRRILVNVRKRYPALDDCKATRIADFLVWTVGSKKLWQNSKEGVMP